MDSPILFSQEVLCALQEFHDAKFGASPPNPDSKLPDLVAKAIEDVAMVGIVCYPWQLLRMALLHLMIQVVPDNDGTNDFRASKQRMAQYLGRLSDAPFTIQRLAEICLHPTKHYQTAKKRANALETQCRVTTVLSVLSPGDYNAEVAHLMSKMQEEVQKKKELEDTVSRALEAAQQVEEMDTVVDMAVDDLSTFAATTMPDDMETDAMMS